MEASLFIVERSNIGLKIPPSESECIIIDEVDRDVTRRNFDHSCRFHSPDMCIIGLGSGCAMLSLFLAPVITSLMVFLLMRCQIRNHSSGSKVRRSSGKSLEFALKSSSVPAHASSSNATTSVE